MSKIIYIAQLYEGWPDRNGNPSSDWRVNPEKCFLTEEAAVAYALSRHPDALTNGWEYIWPDDGTITWRCYWIDSIVLEEE